MQNIKNVAMLALLVLRRTDHCLIVGEGAKRFALSHGFKEENLLTEDSRLAWMKWRENMSKDDDWLKTTNATPLPARSGRNGRIRWPGPSPTPPAPSTARA